jgi:hypothetical protein
MGRNTMTIDRRTIFTEAWRSARRMRGQFTTLRAAFAAALRKVWGLVKAIMAEAARRQPTVNQPVSPRWEDENPARAQAVARQKARMGSHYRHCW